MQCPMCKQLRHEGPCDPVYDDEPYDGEPDFIEMAQAFHELESERLAKQKEALNESRRPS